MRRSEKIIALLRIVDVDALLEQLAAPRRTVLRNAGVALVVFAAHVAQPLLEVEMVQMRVDASYNFV